ncbi:hypothetical protein Val02_69230 [Virgisporangium aliadipatigenens]|uniref:Uncharacterized protein n=1 Tax=Virgisporangium aliadipatigenens TaxID=741659 RepID=A0A8J4DVD7_9ACTN|nr:hypothetical protein [Virgisporangium aliadipatigenens]GIJ50037.1 hypothetical protein Val02_69230 [Virgisporangium aliadipatigenens]
MRPVTPELAAAIEAAERRPVLAVRVDWDGDGYDGDGSVDDLSALAGEVVIDRALAGELPDEVSIVEGSAAASLTVDLDAGGWQVEDETGHAAWYFSAANPDGPFSWRQILGRPVTVDVGFHTTTGPQWVRRFTGRTRALPVSSRRRSAQLRALDGRERLRQVVQVPGAVTRDVGLTATWLVSYVLHQCGIPPSPPPRTPWGTDRVPRLWIPAHGSIQPLIAGTVTLVRRRSTVASTDRAQHRYVPGPFVIAPHLYYNRAAENDQVTGTLTFADITNQGGRIVASQVYRLEMWVRGDSTLTAPPEPMGIVMEDNGPDRLKTTGRIFLGLTPERRLRYYCTARGGTAPVAEATGPQIPADGQWHFIGVQIDILADEVTFALDQRPPVTVETPTAAPYNEICPSRVVFTAWAPFAELHVTSDPLDAPWLNTVPFTPGARLDPSVLTLDAVVEREPREAWALLSEIAAAEQAVIGFDEDGVFAYRNRTRLTDRDAVRVVRTLSAESAITDLDAEVAIDRVRNVVTVPYTPVVMDTAVQVRTWVYETRDLHTVPANGTVEVWASPERPLADVDLDGYAVTEQPNFPNTYVTLSRTPEGTQLVFDNITMTVVAWTVGTLRIRIVNGNAFDLHTANSAGFPTIGVAGVASRVDRPIGVQVRDPDSEAVHGQQPYAASANPWIQRREVADTLARALLADLATPHLVVTNLVIVGDPRLQLGDRVRVVDRDGIALDGEYWITAIRDRIRADGPYTQTLALRRAAPR